MIWRCIQSWESLSANRPAQRRSGQMSDRDVRIGSSFRRISICSCPSCVCWPAWSPAENCEWDDTGFFEISLTESHLVSFLWKLTRCTKVQLAHAFV